MNPLTRVLLTIIACTVVFMLALHFAPLNYRPYYSEIPLAASARGAVSVDMEVEGKTTRMTLTLYSPGTLLSKQPHEIDEWALKSEPHPGYYKAHQTWPQMDAAVRLGAYRRTLSVNSMSPAWAATGEQGGLGSGMFQSFDLNESPRVTLNVRAKKMILFWRPDRPKMQAGPDDVLLPYQNDTVPLPIGGRAPVKFGLDFSSPQTFLSDTLAKSFGRSSKHPFNNFRPLWGGKPLPLLVGKRTWMIAAPPCPTDFNILGQDVLKNYRITIDYWDNIILFESYDKRGTSPAAPVAH